MNKKVRVDFTEGWVFSKNQRLNKNDLDFLSALDLEFPWSYNKIIRLESDEDLSKETENVLFLTGTNSQIKYKKEYLQMTNGEMCECCGEKIKKFPWGRYSKYMFLCDSCAARMEKEYGRDMFGMKKQSQNIEYPWWLIV